MISTIEDLCSDIWQQIFEYFETIELFETFTHITTAVDQVLFNENERFRLRGLTLDADLKDVSKQIPLNRVISLTLHNACCCNVIDQCPELRLLKLIGTAEWVMFIIRIITHQNTKLEQLTVDIPRIESLSQLLLPILSICSLRRLEISADELEDDRKVYSSAMVSSKIEQFVLRSCSIIEWNNLLCTLPDFTNIRLLSISLIDCNQKTIPSFIFQNLRVVSLGLLDAPFNWIIQLVATIPCLTKLILTGLVNSDGFVINDRWIQLFESASTLARICVNLSLEQDKDSYHCEKLQTKLRAFNLQLICNEDDNDYYLSYERVHRWWMLTGIITRS
jgi:hypothetical protein